MTQHLISYFVTMITFFIIDFVWLGFVAKKFYSQQLGHLMLEKFNIPVAIGFYLTYGIGIIIFAVAPALENNDWKHAALYGALFGFFCYATYDLTNMATLKDWPMMMSVVDMAWGTVLTASAATGGYLITTKFFS